ncbi:Uncharacterised protein [Chlamydia trachomatis]|nr:Uncharacterised protein [Chlamydia trachomatis]
MFPARPLRPAENNIHNVNNSPIAKYSHGADVDPPKLVFRLNPPTASWN